MHRLLFQYDPVSGHRFIPDLRARVEHESGGYRVRTNGLGFRSDWEFTARPKAGVRRILLFGDSYTAGDGVENADRYGDVLEKLLQDVEVCTLAVSGTGTDQQFLTFRELGPRLEHDLVVAAVYLGNAARNLEQFHQWATP